LPVQGPNFGCGWLVFHTAAREVLANRLAARGREDPADRAGVPLPKGLCRVIEVDNSGPLAATVEAVLTRLQPESA